MPTHVSFFGRAASATLEAAGSNILPGMAVVGAMQLLPQCSNLCGSLQTLGFKTALIKNNSRQILTFGRQIFTDAEAVERATLAFVAIAFNIEQIIGKIVITH